MAECENLGKCDFFHDKMKDMPATSALMKTRYCLENPTGCARYIIAKKLGREMVPKDLFPSQKNKAENILRNSI